jgi:hypothetical protein
MLHRLLPLILLCSLAHAAPSTQPIALGTDPSSNLLRQWWFEGSAAGNAGDWYDNRDRGHSDLNTKPYPQLQRFVYSREELDGRRDWAMQTVLRPFVCFGNSSTSAPVTANGSNVRMYYVNPRGLDFLYAQYTHSNLYMYPEHRDHDPGHNGLGDGYGDVYPTNTPYLITSQGSSGSDQPFMQAMPHVLAAFRPEVKKKLVETGTLMPTIQMILRRTYKPVIGEKDYLSYKAHPTVFEGSLINPEAMVRYAHAIPLGKIPPMVQMRVTSEDEQVAGKDFFEPHFTTEKLCDTPAVIARLFRGAAKTRKLIVSAEKSADLNHHPLQYHWLILRGDPERTHIHPLNEAASVVEITVDYQERRPIFPGAALESNRVDIALILHNGTYFSAPGFVTFFFFDNEGRGYDEKGRILDIGYSMGETTLNISYRPLLESLKSPAPSPAAALLKSNFNDKEWPILATAIEEYITADGLLADALERQKSAQTAAQKPNLEPSAKKLADAALSAANAHVERSKKFANDILDQKREGLGAARARIEAILHAWLADPRCYESHRALFPAIPKDALHHLATFGLAKPGPELVLTPIRPEALTPYELCLIQQFNGQLLSTLFKDQITSTFRVNFVDSTLSPPKPWRDVYHFDETGKPEGWTRYQEGKTTDFTPDGLAIERDKAGQIIRTRPVKYTQAPNPQRGQNHNPVQWSPE